MSDRDEAPALLDEDDAAFSSQGDELPPSEEEPERAPRRVWHWVVGAALLAIIVALVLPAVSTLQLGYYQRYAKLGTRMTAWQHSTHALVSCAECHVNAGPKGKVQFWARSIPAFYSQLISGPGDQNVLGIPGASACQKCHTSYRKASPSGDLLIPHRAHVEVVGADCSICHVNLVHSRNTAGFNSPEMSSCLDLCHNGIKAGVKTCSKCHTGKQVPESHKHPDFLQKHNTLTEEIKCGKCHGWSPDYCKECHKKLPTSHKGNWKKAHRVRAEERGTKGCLFCHEGGAKFCDKCHDTKSFASTATSSTPEEQQ